MQKELSGSPLHLAYNICDQQEQLVLTAEHFGEVTWNRILTAEQGFTP